MSSTNNLTKQVFRPRGCEEHFSLSSHKRDLRNRRTEFYALAAQLDNCPRTASISDALEKSFIDLGNMGMGYLGQLLLEFSNPKTGTVVIKHCYDRVQWRPNIKSPIIGRNPAAKGSDEAFVVITARTPGDRDFKEPMGFTGGLESVTDAYSDTFDAMTCGTSKESSELVFWPMMLICHLIKSHGFKVIADSSCVNDNDTWYQVSLWDSAVEVRIKIHLGNIDRAAKAAFRRDPTTCE